MYIFDLIPDVTDTREEIQRANINCNKTRSIGVLEYDNSYILRTFSDAATMRKSKILAFKNRKQFFS